MWGALPGTLWSLGSNKKPGAGPGRVGFAKAFSPPEPTATCVSAAAPGRLAPLSAPPDPWGDKLEGLGRAGMGGC